VRERDLDLIAGLIIGITGFVVPRRPGEIKR
jgi:hypothetical protein